MRKKTTRALLRHLITRDYVKNFTIKRNTVGFFRPYKLQNLDQKNRARRLLEPENPDGASSTALVGVGVTPAQY